MLFEDAKFGEPFLTRDTRKAIFIRVVERFDIFEKVHKKYAILIIESFSNDTKEIAVDFKTGKFPIPNADEYDIVSRYFHKLEHEELEDLAVSEAVKNLDEIKSGYVTKLDDQSCLEGYHHGFMDGYNLAIKEVEAKLDIKAI